MKIAIVVPMVLSFFLYFFIPPILDGIERKIKASIQSRYGPPSILQTWYDILKLMSKETITSIEIKYSVISLSISITLTFFLTILISYIVLHTVLELIYTALLIVIILSIHTLHLMLYVFSTNPFSIIGTFRVMFIDIANEIGLVTFITLVTVSSFIYSSLKLLLFALSFIPLLIAIYVSNRRLPYDLHEAEPELASGSIIELSGPLLGLYLYNHILERYTTISLSIALAMLVLKLFNNYFVNIVFLHLFTSILYIIFATISSILGRSRVDTAFKTLILIYFLAIVIWIGVYLFGQTI